MISSIKIKGYRTFKDFSMNDLGRVNLLVGKNNCGKTSILEAMALLWSGNDLTSVWQILNRRGEQPVLEFVAGRPIQQEVEIAHFFSGHQAPIGSAFQISTTNQKPGRSIKFQITEAKAEENPALFNFLSAQDPTGAGATLKITGTPNIAVPPIPLTRRGSLRNDVYAQALQMSRVTKSQAEPLQYITTESLQVPQLQQLWNDIITTPEEELVVRALQFIDSQIERIGPITSPYWLGSQRGGFVVRRKGEERAPIGSFGDGIWRLFALAVALSRSKGGILLVDEIDTGLHYTVMRQMWSFVIDVCREFNIQVFATTHSYDCIHSLAFICSDEETAKEITVQHIESGSSESIQYTDSEIKLAARRHIEMR